MELQFFLKIILPKTTLQRLNVHNEKNTLNDLCSVAVVVDRSCDAGLSSRSVSCYATFYGSAAKLLAAETAAAVGDDRELLSVAAVVQLTSTANKAPPLLVRTS